MQKKLDRIAAEATSRNTFGVIASEYIERLEANGAAQSTLKKNRWFLEELCRPISTRTITEITPAEILDLLKRIEKKRAPRDGSPDARRYRLCLPAGDRYPTSDERSQLRATRRIA